ALGLLQPLDGELGPALEAVNLALDLHEVALVEGGSDRLGVVPDPGVELARPILEGELEERLAVAARPLLPAPEEEDAGGALTQLADLAPKLADCAARSRRPSRPANPPGR